MADTYTETSTKNYGQRLGGAFKGIIFGIILFMAGTYLLWWNEGRTVHSADAIAEAKLTAEELSNLDKVDPAFNGKLIHATGIAKAEGTIIDPDFGISQEAIAILRKVEFYQWRESSTSKTEKKVGGGEETVTTYTYQKDWTDRPINSANFKQSDDHLNKVLLNIDDRSIYANKVTFGAYNLSENQIRSITGSKPLTVSISNDARIALQNKLPLPNLNLNPFSKSDLSATMVHISNNTIYLGLNPTSPNIGDLRISFREIPSDQAISIIAEVNGNSFKSWQASNGEQFSRLTNGIVSLEAMIQSAEEDNKMLAWCLRILGIILVIAGLKVIFTPLSVLGDVIPLLGTMIGHGANIAATLLGLAWSFIIIAVAWIRFRPTLAYSLIGVAIVCLILSFIGKKSRATASSADLESTQSRFD